MKGPHGHHMEPTLSQAWSTPGSSGTWSQVYTSPAPLSSEEGPTSTRPASWQVEPPSRRWRQRGERLLSMWGRVRQGSRRPRVAGLPLLWLLALVSRPQRKLDLVAASCPSVPSPG